VEPQYAEGVFEENGPFNDTFQFPVVAMTLSSTLMVWEDYLYRDPEYPIEPYAS